MKSLLIKDFKLMKFNIRSIIIGGIILGVIFYLNKTGEFTIGGGFLVAYMSFMGMLAGARTINLDKEDNSNTYLFSLPISRKTYILEKYLFSFIIGMICFVISLIIVLIITYFKHEFNFIVTLYTALAVYSIIIMMVDVMLPVELKYNRLISWIALIIVIFSVLFLALWFGSIAVKGGITAPFLVNMTYPELLMYLYLFAFLATVISILVSFKIIKRKEF